MNECKYVRFDNVRPREIGNGFFGVNLVELEHFELTYITGNKVSSHNFHHHDDMDEILIWLRGECDLILMELG